MEKPSFDELPEYVQEIKLKVDIILSKISSCNLFQPEGDVWFNLIELCNYLPDHPTSETVYGWINKALIPHYKGKKKLRFLKSEIDTWLREGKRKTMDEIKVETIGNVTIKKNGKRT